MNFRTDLALERRESFADGEIKGVEFSSREEISVKISHINVLDERGEKALGKPKGHYITVEFPSLKGFTENLEFWSEIISNEISHLIPAEGTVLVAGLGNSDITPDALGPECVSQLLATRHIKSEIGIPSYLSELRGVAGVVPGVLGNTGIETAEILKGVVSQIEPCAVIVIDALAARSLERLGNTVQMCDTGVSPGSGVGNRRKRIDADFLGVPVIAVGVPTVVDGLTVALDIMEKGGIRLSGAEKRSVLQSEKGMMVTPKEIDLVVKRAAKLVSLSLNRALQPKMNVQDITALVSSV